jgi:uncharacterized protein (DUF924 family)
MLCIFFIILIIWDNIFSYVSFFFDEIKFAKIDLLDEGPRNIFRNTPEAYATDSKALEFAKIAVDKGWDKGMPHIQKRYIYSPFDHSENLEIQKRSVQLFTELGDSQHLFWANSFYDTIKKYGRFPHRDHILGTK